MDETHLRVIIADDTFDDLQIMATTLEYHAVEVHAVNNARECIALANQILPHVVITDLAMPEMDGWAVLSAVRNNPATANTRVIAVTAYHSAKLAEQVMTGGFDGYFPKPINPLDFVEQLWHIVKA